jgi:putative transposase
LRAITWKERRAIYGAATQQEAEHAFDEFAAIRDGTDRTIRASGRLDWERLTVFFAYSPTIRNVISTTNAIESLNES